VAGAISSAVPQSRIERGRVAVPEVGTRRFVPLNRYGFFLRDEAGPPLRRVVLLEILEVHPRRW